MSEGLRFAEWKQPSQAASWAEHEKTARRQSAAGSRLRLFWQNTKSKAYVTHQVDSVFAFYVFVFYRCQIKKENSSGMKSARASDTPRQEQKQSTVVLKSRYEIMIVTTENPWQLPGPIWSFFFFSPLRGHFAIVRWCRGIFSYSKFLMSDPASPPPDLGIFGCLFSTHPNSGSKRRIKISLAARVLLEQSNPKDEGDKLPVSTCMRPAETGKQRRS